MLLDCNLDAPLWNMRTFKVFLFETQTMQGGSVMCDRPTPVELRDYPAHPHFWHNCLPNEEQMEKHKKFKYFF